MSKKTLAQDLGVRYVNEFLVGSCVKFGDDVAFLRMIEDDHIHADVVVNEKGGMERKLYPLSTLKSFADLQYPALGYRQMPLQNGKNHTVVHLSSIRSAHRGLRADQIRQTNLPVFNYLGSDYADAWVNAIRGVKLNAIFKPKYTPFSAGLRQLLDGSVAGFAVNENLAVGISCTRAADRAFDVYYRERVVGSVTSNGIIHIANKVMHRHNLSKDLRQ